MAKRSEIRSLRFSKKLWKINKCSKDFLSYNNNKPATAANEPAPIPATPTAFASPEDDFDDEADEELEDPDLEAALALDPDKPPRTADEAFEAALPVPLETADDAFEAALSVPLEIADETFEVALAAIPPLDESAA